MPRIPSSYLQPRERRKYMAEENNTQEVRSLKIKCNKLLDEISRLEQEATQSELYVKELEEQISKLKEKLECANNNQKSLSESVQKERRPEKKSGGKNVKRFFWKYSGMLAILGISLGVTIVILTVYFTLI